MLSRYVGALLTLATLAASACTEDGAPETAVMVVVSSDLELGTELASLRVRVLDEQGSERSAPQTFPLGGSAGAALPFRFRLRASEGTSAETLLVVSGLSPEGNTAVEQRAVVVFVPRAVRELNVFLARKCLNNLCGEDPLAQTCDSETGMCVATPRRRPAEPDAGNGMDGAVEGDPDAGTQADASNDASNAADAGPDACGPGLVTSSAGCVLDPCAPSPCQHGGVCTSNDGQAECNCDGTGYSGERCETDINECATAMCPPEYPCMQTEPPGYTCRGQFADWPMPDSTPGAKFVHSYSGYDTIVDERTGLGWQQHLPSTYAGCVTGNGVEQPHCTWEQARAYCENLAYDQKTDWRLPSLIELVSILDGSQFGPAATSHFPDVFSSTGLSVFWTSSTVGGAPSGAWSVPYGLPVAVDKTYAYRVRCVRGPFGAPLPGGSRYVVHSNLDEVEDVRTKLIWQRLATDDSAASLHQAAALCAQRGSGWRVPTWKEFVTLMDYSRPWSETALVDSGAFPNAPAASFITATLMGDRPLLVNTTTGGLANELPGATTRVRCVR